MEKIRHETLGDAINIALIQTRDDIGKTFESIARDCGVHPHSFVADFAAIPDLARKIEPQVDAVLCRPGTAEHAASAVGIPVIAIPVTSFDLVCALYHLNAPFRRAAVFCYRKKFSGVDVIEKLFQCEVIQYFFWDIEEIPGLVDDAARIGVDFCFGGGVTSAHAQKVGLRTVKITPNEDSIFRSVHEALHAIKVRRRERSQAARLEMVFDSISEGIVVTDTEKNVVIYNGTAAKICKTGDADVIGRNVCDIVRDPGIAMTFKAEEKEPSYLKKIQDNTYAIRQKPVVLDQNRIGTVYSFEDITTIQHLEALIRNQLRSKGLVPRYRFDDILSQNPQMNRCKDLAKRYARAAASVVIEGESGTGKEMFAQSMHLASNRATGPFVAVNCAAIPETLLESELFGYEGGAFTGARKEGKPGLFEEAHQGTIFLDEIGEVPAALQARLLRVLQEREVRRVGSNRVVAVDIRIISATNKNLLQKVQEGTFRDDLYYRLNVLNLKIPPLRERKEDISLIAEKLLTLFGMQVTPEIMVAIAPALTAYDWPGNIRELTNILERMSLLIDNASAPSEWAGLLEQMLQVSGNDDPQVMTLSVDMNCGLKDLVREVERKVVGEMLVRNNNDLAAVAAQLKIGRTSVWRKVRSETTH
ncbi:transcriptional regulator with PAS, ATPase and Fis domain [Rhodobium orientis]|uniref:Sigma-54 factor interaction domain-containing protein n=1 Tax=Rhodobium orientis TaxID=34017 RepID=A0A327JVZ8_9HYPH|nr:sigma 54-interacting transcriptional regulator [Rhodobium orientis]MBB4302666.1 transcriptional regulator with PAS, ATPase and Fis domain [Rhodobium orientis]MBK5948449.1 hypothetical protein [Rhodobium orientis]RAI29724.1 hypothetical protein CH339_01515 [Rhodobium orientis]